MVPNATHYEERIHTQARSTDLEELTALAGGERSLAIYHHLSRNGSAAERVQRTGARIREHLDASYALDAVVYHRGTARTFFIATPSRHAALVTARVDALLEGRGRGTSRGTWSS